MALKLFISQPMSDKTDEEIKEERINALKEAKEVLGEDVEEIDTFFEGEGFKSPLEFLGKAISTMAKADVVYFCKDWEKYRGCKIEHTCAIEYGKKVIEK